MLPLSWTKAGASLRRAVNILLCWAPLLDSRGLARKRVEDRLQHDSACGVMTLFGMVREIFARDISDAANCDPGGIHIFIST